MADIVKLGAKGDLRLPRHVRATLGLREGDHLVLTLEDDAIVMKRKARRFAEYLETLQRAPSGRPRA